MWVVLVFSSSLRVTDALQQQYCCAGGALSASEVHDICMYFLFFVSTFVFYCIIFLCLSFETHPRRNKSPSLLLFVREQHSYVAAPFPFGTTAGLRDAAGLNFYILRMLVFNLGLAHRPKLHRRVNPRLRQARGVPP